MPLDPVAKKAYQKDYMAKRRETLRRAVGNEIITPGRYEPGHVHAWERKMGEDTAICPCGEVVKYTGKLLNTHTDGLPDTPELINGMTQKDRDVILASPAINARRRGE